MDKLIFGSGVSSFKEYEDLKNMCRNAMNHGIYKFDTAPSYKTEEIVSTALIEIQKELGFQRDNWYIQTKIDPIQMYEGGVVEYFKDKLSKMKLDYVDCLLIHWPLKKYLEQTWNEMLKLKDCRLTRKIGICNLRISHLKSLWGKGIKPDVLQIERHPLNTFNMENVFCQEYGIEVQDYSPLCKMHPLLKNNVLLDEIAKKYNKNVGQIILRWHIDTGAIPIFTTKNAKRLEDYSNIGNFVLEDGDIEKITSLNINHKLYLESLVCPGF